MRLILCTAAAALALAACQKQAEAPAADTNVAAADANATIDASAAAPAALASINETSWTFTDKDGNNVEESVDAAGKYIAQTTAGKHLDHGTAVMKDGKACFTSAMDESGEMCWSDPHLEIGQSGETVSDKGEKLTIKRVAYAPLTM